MPRRFAALAWTAAAATYVLIVLGAVVRISGSGLGCGDDWPVCHGRLIPPLSDIKTFIEWNHRLFAGLVTILVVLLAGAAWRLRKQRGAGSGEQDVPRIASYVALGLLVVQIALGGIVVKQDLQPYLVALHFGNALLLLGTLIGVATGGRLPAPRSRAAVAALWGFVTLLLGALTANLGAATACTGFPLCNGQIIPSGTWLQGLHWVHRLAAYGLVLFLAWWAWESKSRAPRLALGVALLQIVIAAAMVSLGVPPWLQAAHAAAGTAVWAVLAGIASRNERGPVAGASSIHRAVP
jgi:heme A synthase